jgi:cytochrome c oxidase subunit 2
MQVVKNPRSTVVALILVLLLGACVPAPVTDRARDVASLYGIFMAAAAVVFVIVTGLIGWSIIRYRATADNGDPAQFHTNVPMEVVWWALPTLLVIGLFVVSAQVLANVDRKADPSALTVKVEGFQWQWRFSYPASGVVLTGEPGDPPQVVLPVGREIEFVLTSPDVIHSFYVPRFLIKRDAIPGITNRIALTIDQAGIYSGQCAEFCGLLHADMRFSIRAVSPADFDAWLKQQAASASPSASAQASP